MKYSDTWNLATTATTGRNGIVASTSNLNSSSSARLPSPVLTPARASRRTSGLTTRYSEDTYDSFTRTNTATGEQVDFKKGDIVIVGFAARLMAHPWLRGGKNTEMRTQSGTGNGLGPKENVGIITSFYAENQGEKRAKIRWLPEPDYVWRDDPTKETWELNELYYTTDSTHLSTTQSISSSRAVVASSVTSSQATSAIDLKLILRHTRIASASSAVTSNSSSSDAPSFFIRKVYDVRPLGNQPFISPIDWDQIYALGKSTGEWDVSGGEDVETSSDEAPRAAKKQLTAKAMAEKREIQRETAVAKKAKLVQKLHGEAEESAVSSSSESEESSDDAGSEDDFDVDAAEEEAELERSGLTANRRGSRRRESSTEDDSDPGVDEDASDDDLPSPSRKRSRAKASSSRSPVKRLKSNVTERPGESAAAQAKRLEVARIRKLKPIQPRLPAATISNHTGVASSPFQLAIAQLHSSATPEVLTGREDQQEEIRYKIGEAIRKARGDLFFISGVPGTGKTATVHAAMRSLFDDEDVDAFDFIEINGLKIAEPTQSFSLLWESLSSGQKVSSKHALTQLERHFSTPELGRKTTVVLVDELDQMVTKKQDVIYNFFNWPHMPHSKLIVVAIANTMDLPERQLSAKIRSRLGPNRMDFKAYNHVQLGALLRARLNGIEGVIDSNAIDLAARKVATVAGDARRVLDITRRCLEKVDQLNSDSPTLRHSPRPCRIADVNETYREMTDYGSNAFLKQLPLHGKIMMYALITAIKKSGLADVECHTVIRWHLDFCRQTAIASPPTHDELFTILTDLNSLRLIGTECQRLDYFQRIKSLVADSDVYTALEGEPMFANHLPGKKRAA